jgi:long-chain acyl-CoA synthetase
MTHLGDIAVPRTMRHGPGAATLPALLAARAAERGNAIALLHKRHGLWRRWTWRETAAETASLAAAIAEHGVRRGEVVAIAGASRPRLLIAMLACQWIGAVPVLVPQAGAGVTLERVLAEHAVRLAFVAGEHEVHAINAARGRLAAPLTVVCDDLRGLRSLWTPRLRSWDSFAATASAAPPAPLALPSDTAALVYADDDTEAVALGHAALTEAAAETARTFALGPLDRAMVALPLGWREVLKLGPAQALHTGFALAFPEHDTTALRDLREVGPTLLFGPPALFRRLRQEAFLATGGGWAWRGLSSGGVRRALLAAPTRDRLGVSRVRAAICFGGVAPPRVATFFAALGIRVRPLDAGTELSATAEQRAEATLRGSVFIRDAVATRTGAGELAALIAIDGGAVARWAEAEGKRVRSSEDLASLDEVRALIGREIVAASGFGAQAPAISTFLIAPRGFSAAAGELTAHGEARRDAIERSHESLLASLRAGEGSRLPVAEAPHEQPRESVDPRTAALDSVWI